MAALEGQVGFREGPNNENPWGPWQGVRNAAYCDSFSQWGACEHGGYRWPAHCQFGWKGSAYCPFTEKDSSGLGLWRSRDTRPARGWQILFDWTGWGGADHIGTVWGTDDGWKTIWCVEANAGSPQGVHWIRRDWTYIRGFVALPEADGEPPPPPGPRELHKGLTGDDVHWLQSRLTELGYHVPGGIDGDFGDGTEQAVMNFQGDWDLEVDGIVGPATRESLADDSHRADMQPPPPPPEPTFPTWPGRYMRRGDEGEDVTTFQARLAERGWVNSRREPLVADGWFGRETDRVVRLFQEYAELKVDGVVGPVTWNALWTVPVTS